MEWIITHKNIILFTLVVILFLCESIAPFRTWHEKRWRHIARNVIFIAGNTLVMSMIYLTVLGVGLHIGETVPIGIFRITEFNPLLQGIIVFLLLDMALYFWHRANHTMPFLWRFHKVHHSDRDLDVTSAMRFHIGELLFSAIVKSVLLALLGVPLVFILAFDVVVTAFALFNHSNISLGRYEPLVRAVIVTPAMHRIHHSMVQKETDTNYTTILSIWDRLFGSYHFFADQQSLEIGLYPYRTKSSRSLYKMYVMPFHTKK